MIRMSVQHSCLCLCLWAGCSRLFGVRFVGSRSGVSLMSHSRVVRRRRLSTIGRGTRRRASCGGGHLACTVTWSTVHVRALKQIDCLITEFRCFTFCLDWVVTLRDRKQCNGIRGSSAMRSEPDAPDPGFRVYSILELFHVGRFKV